MKNIKNLFVLGLFLSGCLMFSVDAFAHTLWINATDYRVEFHPKYGAKTNVYFGWGHSYPVDDFLAVEDLQGGFSLIYPDGGIEKITPNAGGFLATQINFKQPGSYIVTASKKPGFYAMYVDKGEVHHKIGPKTGLNSVILSLYYEQYAKSLIDVGEAEDDAFSKPVGHRLEIIPLENPYKLHGCGGHFLPVVILFEGKPARFCKVYATYMGFSTGDDFAYATSTNGEGIAKIRLTHWGAWLIKADIKLPALDDLKDKCNELHYTATLTFEIP
ncbi:MAG: DUF4198 domain-containing protein [bacterium]